jgi:hypothetical protein
MSDALQKEAREAIRPHVAKRAAAHEQVYGTAMTMTEEDACCADFRVGYLAAATAREKEIEELRAKLVQQAHDYRAQVVFWGENADQRAAEIATLRARVEGMEKVANLADSIAHEFEVAVESRNPVGGMSVPPTGDFISCAKLPSAVGRMRWWAREIRKAQPIPAAETNNNAPQQGV